MGNEKEERMKEAHPLSQWTLFIMTIFFPLYVKKYSLWEFKITKTLFIIPFSVWKAQFKLFCVCCWGRLVLFVSFCALHVGFLSFQCGGLARELHTLQIQPDELHGYQLCGLRPCGENLQTQTHYSILQYFSIDRLPIHSFLFAFCPWSELTQL